MVPSFTKQIKLHYFGTDGILIVEDNHYFLNNAETTIIEKIDGIKSIEDICSEIANNFNSQVNDRLKEIVLNKLKSDPFSNFISDAKVHYPAFITGEKYREFPLNIPLELTNKCNLKCVHCYKEAGYNKRDEINTDILLKKLIPLSLRVDDIQLSGGEPMMHKDFNKIISFAKSYFKNVNITTTATLINVKNVILFKGLDSVQVSLYSVHKDKHEEITLTPKSYEMTIRGIKILTSNNIPTTISFIVTKDNTEELEDFVKLGIDLGVSAIKFGEFSRLGRGLNLGRNWELDAYNTQRANIIINNLRHKYSSQINVEDWAEDKVTQKKIDMNHKGFSCGAGNLSWTITEKGNIKPWVFLPEDRFKTANIINETLDNITRRSQITNLYSELKDWENELNKNRLSTEMICPVMKNYLDVYKELR